MQPEERELLLLPAVRQELQLLRIWASDRLNIDTCDRQYIAEHMLESIERILAGKRAARRPF